ncbi:MAG: ThiF family adenylyltransferase [Armatimonadota bacterium]
MRASRRRRELQLTDLNDWELEKYKRQMQIPGFGPEAQKALKNSAALITRVGGLGGPTALYLAAAGIGKLLLAHGGNLTPSNLNRQILMRGDAVGQPRIPQARETILRFNPDVDVVALAENASEENVADWVSQVDVVCDTSPSFEERLLLNRECWRQGKPLVDSAMSGMECQITTLVPGETPCLQCIVADVPDEWEVYGFGVLGAVPGALGCMTALEAIKVLTGFGEALKGTLLTLDMEDMTFQRYRIRPRADCPVCGA